MEMILGQLRYFGASLLWGIALMFLYDLLEVFRCKIRHGRLWLLLEDWLFWLVAAVFVFQMIFALNYGIIRNFFVLSLIGGMALYRAIVKRRVICGILSIISFVMRPYVWIAGKIRKKHGKSKKKP